MRPSRCGRCDNVILAKMEEDCWYCLGPLCYDCWNVHGCCKHKEADESNERARNFKVGDLVERIPTGNRKAAP